MRRRDFITLLSGAPAWPDVLFVQSKVPHVGYVDPGSTSNDHVYFDEFQAGLRDLGYVAGKNIIIEDRWVEGKYDRIPELVKELIHLNVDVIVASSTPVALAAKQATATIPIVMLAGDALGSKLVASLARPGGNVTGLTFFLPEVSAKRLELIKELVPRVERVAVLYNPWNTSTLFAVQAIVRAAPSINVEIQEYGITRPDELANAISLMVKRRADFVIVNDDGMLESNSKLIADLAKAQRIPSIGFDWRLVQAGALLSYGADHVAATRQSAIFVDKIIRGAKPNVLPVEQAIKFKLVINLKTAKELSITVPPALLARADEVIE
jgi:putative ABC transport system substrate-binding protein